MVVRKIIPMSSLFVARVGSWVEQMPMGIWMNLWLIGSLGLLGLASATSSGLEWGTNDAHTGRKNKLILHSIWMNFLGVTRNSVEYLMRFKGGRRPDSRAQPPRNQWCLKPTMCDESASDDSSLWRNGNFFRSKTYTHSYLYGIGITSHQLLEWIVWQR